MSDLRRLRKTTRSGLERALLDAGRGYSASQRTHAKTLAALGVGVSVVASAGTSSANTTSLLSKLGWVKLGWTAKVALTVSSLGAVATVPAYMVWRGHAAESSSSMVAPSSVENATSLVEPTQETTQPTAPVASSHEKERGRARDLNDSSWGRSKAAKAVGANSASGGGPAAAGPVFLKGELDLIDAARSVATHGDYQGGLAILDAYARAYPRGRLQLEADVLRMDVLSRNGQVPLARRLAEDFLARHPKSVLSARVRAFLRD